MKITLCGSTRFMEQYNAWNRWLALQGHVVYSVATSVKDDFSPTDDEKETLDLVHLAKILNSDTILVIDCLRTPVEWKNNASDRRTEAWELLTAEYIGESTRREIKWAKILGKKATYTHHYVVLPL